MGNEINHRFENIDGNFDISTGKLICVGNKKYGDVTLCFKESMNIAFASIKLYSSNRAIDADAIYADALVLGNEIAERWNVSLMEGEPSDKAEELQDKLDKILSWTEAYPLNIFPEPDFKKVHEILKEHGMSLDAVSASNMRHVVDGIKAIIQPQEPEGVRDE